MDDASVNGDLSFVCDTEMPPLVPEGRDYQVAFIRPGEKRLWGHHKVFLWFKIVTPGEWHGREIFMACTVAKTGKWGPSSKYWGNWVLASGRRPRKGEKMSTKVFRNKVFTASVRTVGRSGNQASRNVNQQYSVIDNLVDVAAGGNLMEEGCKSVETEPSSVPGVVWVQVQV